MKNESIDLKEKRYMGGLGGSEGGNDVIMLHYQKYNKVK